MTTTHFLALVCLACYLIASLAYLFSIARRAATRLGRFASGCLVAGFILHTILIFPFVQEQEQLVPSQRGEYFFWLSWLLPCAFFLFKSKFGSPVLGAFLAPGVTLLFASSSYLMHRDTFSSIESNNPLLLMHVVPALLAELSLIIVFIASAAFLVQERRIKKKAAISVMSRGPSLEALDGMARRFVVVGFVSMGLAVLSGAMWAMLRHYSLFRNDFYQWAAIFTWVVLASLLYLRVQLGWSPQRISRISLFLTGIFIAVFMTMALVGGNEFHLGYGV